MVIVMLSSADVKVIVSEPINISLDSIFNNDIPQEIPLTR